MAVTLVTGNRNKAAEFSLLLGKVDVIHAEYPEIRSDDPAEIAKVAAKFVSDKLGKAIVVEDSGLFIDALGGFPGTYTKWVTAKVGNKGILALMRGVKNRRCFYRSAVAYCKPGGEPVCFIGSQEGKIARREAGKKGWGNDPIFIPKGKSKTYAQLKNPAEPGRFRIDAIMQLRDFLSARDN
ncbi:non-canonical purine NTP pyrophosphatase [Candidatus Woesearchaeota archaeon]|nr:non-canonical purine NTP pyrophosphatase [Candidatus Woesearchaeota archaeon]